MNRNKLSAEQASDRMKAQMPLKLKWKKADVIIDNSGNFEDLLNDIKSKIKIVADLLSSPKDE